MLFNSFKFIMFFILVVSFYFLLPHKYRWILLLGASYYFYMSWKPEYIILILISTWVSWYSSLLVEKAQNQRGKKFFLTACIAVNLGILLIFKYFNFFNDSLRAVFHHFALPYGVPNFTLLLPVGISFYTFQTLSYTIDVYRGTTKAEKHFGIYSLYVTFFPQLVAGPIERSERLLPQFYERHAFDYRRVTDGLKLMLWGYFKKVVVADRLAVIVNQVYNHPTQYQGLPFIIATIFFGFQIYGDFSGYSDIAVGAAQVMGFRLMENFKRPYFAKSIAEFWRRWHISLSTWFKDYFYVPMGGNRRGLPRKYLNSFLTFLLSGLWHGANWTFVIWGALHGLYMVLEGMTKGIRQQFARAVRLDRVPLLHKGLQGLITFSLVSFAWIFFRANTITDAFYIVQHLFTGIRNWSLPQTLALLDVDHFSLHVGIIAIMIMEAVHWLQRDGSVREKVSRYPLVVRWAFYYALLLFILIFGAFGSQEFIYFQF